VVDSDNQGVEILGRQFLSNKEPLTATPGLVQKLLKDEEIGKSVL